MTDVPKATLNTGASVPLLGLGCWVPGGGQGERAYEMCRKAIDLGYRHLDTAANYVNEENVGQAIRDSSIPRSEFFVTTKLDNNVHSKVSSALNTSLAKLGLDYVDLYLIHWPQAKTDDGVTLKPDEYPTINDTWSQMEQVFEEGKAKAIGVSNFSVKALERLSETWKVVPAVNQVEMHPFLPWNELKTYCDGKGIHLTAYAPLGRPTEGSGIPSILKNDLIVKLAEKYGVTPGQILLGWGIQRGTSVIPKSESEERLRQNITLVKLEDEDVKAIDELHTQPGLHRSILGYGSRGVLGWTFEQIGWPFGNGGVVIKM